MRTQSPDLKDLAFTLDNGVKVFHLIAEPVRQQIVPNKTLDLWGFNGSAPGPTIQVVQGDKVRVIFKNELPEPTSMHWHGFEDQIGSRRHARYQSGAGPARSEASRTTSPLNQEGHLLLSLAHGHAGDVRDAGCGIMHPKVPDAPRLDKDF